MGLLLWATLLELR
jgi:hypothetical protein